MSSPTRDQPFPFRLEFPPELPISVRAEEITAAIQASQVVILAGETGSGKTTQLPKIALTLGRGKANSGRLIGHTQPRRIAASSVAKRIAQELNTHTLSLVGEVHTVTDPVGSDNWGRVIVRRKCREGKQPKNEREQNAAHMD